MKSDTFLEDRVINLNIFRFAGVLFAVESKPYIHYEKNRHLQKSHDRTFKLKVTQDEDKRMKMELITG